MSKVELVQYGLEGDRQQRRAADELFRRYHVRFRDKGMLDRKAEREDPDAAADDGMPGDGKDNVVSLL